MAPPAPTLIILAGPNGAGKSSLFSAVIGAPFLISLNADIIASGIGGDGALSELQAGKIFLGRLHEALASSVSVVIETTLAGSSWTAVIRKAKEQGYTVGIYFLFIDSEDRSVQRVRGRVALGGHDIPEATIRRRYHRSLSNFADRYRQLTDWWVVIDNSDLNARAVARGRGGVIDQMQQGHLIAEILQQDPSTRILNE